MLNVYLVVNITIKFILTLLYKIFFIFKEERKKHKKKNKKYNKKNILYSLRHEDNIRKKQQLIFLSVKETLKQLFILSFLMGTLHLVEGFVYFLLRFMQDVFFWVIFV